MSEKITHTVTQDIRDHHVTFVSVAEHLQSNSHCLIRKPHLLNAGQIDQSAVRAGNGENMFMILIIR